MKSSRQRFAVPWVNRWFGEAEAATAEVGADGVWLGSRREALDDAWSARKFLFWSRVTRPGTPSFLLSKEDGNRFIALARDFKALRDAAPLVQAADERLSAWKKLESRDRYLPRHDVAKWAHETKPLAEKLPFLAAIGRLDPDNPLIRLSRLLADPHAAANIRNDRYVADELRRRQPWFDRILPRPSAAQREIAVRDETNTLVVAGAGTGKTATIITKVRYLLETGTVSAANLLIVAFNREAAEEIRTRCVGHGVEGLTVLTFHALGLRILGEKSGEKPPLLSELSTEEGRDDVISGLIDELSQDPVFATSFARFIYLYAQPYTDPFKASSQADYVKRTKGALAKSAHGDWVRSIEELRLSNWLHAHGVEFEYEAPYPHRDPDGFTRYRPDFTIRIRREGERERVVYLEHQALDRHGNPPPWMARYREKVAWARAHHQRHGTTLVESFSWWFSSGEWEQRLRTTLQQVGLELPQINWVQRLAELTPDDDGAKRHDRKLTLSLLRRSIDLKRTRPEPVSGTAGDGARQELFDRLLLPVEAAYQAYKIRKQGIDFEDMISAARTLAEQGGYPAPWTHYIIDEYQDASLSRLALIQSLRQQRPDSRLTCIGDDWQAIIRFSGGDIRVMTEFKKRVGEGWRADLGQTYRYARTVADLSVGFVTRNPAQLKKSILPALGKKDRPVRVVYTSRPEESGEIQDHLAQELARLRDEKHRDVLLLSRYRRSIPGLADQEKIRRAFPELVIEWRTAHAAKGLEADAVVIGDLQDHALGFPCLREDDPLLVRLLPPADQFEHAEERRLFYVAMTRAKSRLVLMVDAAAPSPFVTELLKGDAAAFEIEHRVTPAKPCPRCEAGHLVSRDGMNGRFYGCTNYPVCGYTEQSCPSCGQGFLIPDQGTARCSRHDRGCTHTARTCPDCRLGWLEVKVNRANGNRFYGCSRFRDDDDPCRHTENFGTARQGRRSRW